MEKNNFDLLLEVMASVELRLAAVETAQQLLYFELSKFEPFETDQLITDLKHICEVSAAAKGSDYLNYIENLIAMLRRNYKNAGIGGREIATHKIQKKRLQERLMKQNTYDDIETWQ